MAPYEDGNKLPALFTYAHRRVIKALHKTLQRGPKSLLNKSPVTYFH